MTRKELDEEIEYIHSNRTSKKLLRPFCEMWNIIVEALNTYTSLSTFMNDFINLYRNYVMDEHINLFLNDLYLLALLHNSCDEDLKE